MNKIFYFLCLCACMVSCGSYRSLDLNRLTTGMTKAEVEKLAGLPSRVLAVNESGDGYQEVLEYRTTRGDIYALEFWDDYLTGYEYLYEDIQYVPSPYPPTIFPPYGRPLYVYPGNAYRPNYNRPNYNRPNYNTNRPGSVNRPNNNSNNNTNVVTPPSTSRTPTAGSSGSGNNNSSGSTNRTNSTSRTRTE